MRPTKEELAGYFINNRKYFDELASFYKQTDTEYYNKNIAPYYGMQYSNLSSRKSVKPVMASVIALFAVLVMGLIMFFVVNQFETEPNVNTEEELESNIEADEIEMTDSLTNLKELSDFEKGIMYYKLGEYDKAEKLLERVPESDKYYREARMILTEIGKKVRR